MMRNKIFVFLMVLFWAPSLYAASLKDTSVTGELSVSGKVGIGTAAGTTGLIVGDAASPVIATGANDVYIKNNLEVDGIIYGTLDASSGTTFKNIQIGVTDDNRIDTVSGMLTLDSATNTLKIDTSLIDLSSQATTIDLIPGTVNALNIDSGLLSFDTNNTRIGIGTFSPDDTLDVTGRIRVSDGGTQPISIGYDYMGENETGLVDVTASKIIAGYRLDGLDKVYIYGSADFDEGLIIRGNNVGIGTGSPRGKLDIVGGDVLIGSGAFSHETGEDDLYIKGNLEVVGTVYGDGAGLTNLQFPGGSIFGNIKIGTPTDNIITTVSDSLTIDAANDTLVLQTGMIDLSTQATSINLIDTTNALNIEGNTFVIDAQNQRVGIGTTNPSAKLEVLNGSFLVEGTTGDTPVSGAGRRLMWIPSKGAFRAGWVNGSQWNDANIGDYSVAMGANTTASGAASVSLGSASVASGGGSTAMGILTTASGIGATAMGRQTTASGKHATSIGYETQAKTQASVALGQYNIGVGSGSETWVATDAVLEVGIGIATASKANALTILKNGKVGIGTITPSELLDVAGDVVVQNDLHVDGTIYGTLDTSSNATFKNIQLGVTGDNTIDTASGDLTINSVSDKLVLQTGMIDLSSQETTLDLGTSGKLSIGSVADTYSSLVVDAENGRVGIGTINPSAKFEVLGGEFLVSGTYDSVTGPTVSGYGTRMMFIPGKAAFRVGRTGNPGYEDGTAWDNANVGIFSFASGNASIASGNASIAMGDSAVARGHFAVAMGVSTASGLGSYSLGYTAVASGDYSTAIGYQTIGSSYASVSLGQFNVGFGNPTVSVPTDPVFEIGIGVDEDHRANAMTVLKNGKVGIGTITPSELLDVAGDVLVQDDLHVDGTIYGTLDTSSSARFKNIQLGVTGDNTIDTASGDLTINSVSDKLVLQTGMIDLSSQVTTIDLGTEKLNIGATGDSYTTLVVDAANARVGIGTTNPSAKLELANDGAILATGTFNSGVNVPDLGAGTRMMWYPKKAAFRAGNVNSTQWDNANVGNYSVSIGWNTTAIGINSTAMGSSTIASGLASFAIGSQSTASGTTSIAMGFQTTASGVLSISTGESTTASGNRSISMGYKTTAQSYASVVLGRWNVVSGTTDSWVDLDPVFAIGIGTVDTPANALTVLKNGDIGIGTVAPQNKLDVNGSIVVGSSFVSAQKVGPTDGLLVSGQVGIGTSIPTSNLETAGTVSFKTAAGAQGLYQDASGLVGIGTTVTQAGLTISQADDAGMYFTNGTISGYMGVGTDDASVELSIESNHDLIIQTNDTEQMRVTKTGFVGIGTPNPQTTLDVAGPIRTVPVPLTCAATVNTDASLGDYFSIAADQSFTLANPTNPVDGQRIMWRIKQDGTGGKTIALDTLFKVGTDITSVVLSVGANKVDYMGAVYNADDNLWYVIAFVKGY